MSSLSTHNELFHGLPHLIQRMFDDADPRPATFPLPVDVVETVGEVRLVAEIPGMDRASLEVTLENGVLTVSGEKKAPALPDGAQYRGERRYGTFERQFRISNRIDSTKIEARYNDGVLEVVMPKSAEAQPRKIEIK
jgi:HSP20 family protein